MKVVCLLELVFLHGAPSVVAGNIIAVRVCILVQEQYRGIQTVVKKSLKLLEALANGNDLVQRRIFDRMDSLLKVEAVECQIASVLKKVKSIQRVFFTSSY